MAFEKKITLEIKGTDFVFNVNAAAFDKMQSEISNPKRLKQTMTNFLMATIDDAQKADFTAIVKQPGAAVSIGGSVIEEYQDDFEIIVKK